MIKKTRSIISISFFLLLLTCSGMEKREHSSKEQAPLKDIILSILDEIDENNNHILSNGYRLNETEDLVEFADLNRQRKEELESKEGECNPLTLPALIMVNKCMHQELIKHLSPDNKHVIAHQTLLETLQKLRKYSPRPKTQFPQQQFPYY